MLKINLAPVEELESPYWWVPDAAVFVLILGIGLFSVESYLSQTRNEIEAIGREIDQINTSLIEMQPDLARFNSLQGKIDQLDYIRRSLTTIAESKVSRYMPIVLLEHIQSLKPDGVWLNRVAFAAIEIADDTTNSEGQEKTSKKINPLDVTEEISVEGSSFNNIVLAEFMTLLKSTRNQDFNPGDIRSQIFFSDVDLVSAEKNDMAGVNGKKGSSIMKFIIRLKFSSRVDPSRLFGANVYKTQQVF